MTDQLGLFEQRHARPAHQMTATDARKLARTGDPETSHKAAARASYRSGSHKAALLAVYLAAPGGLTDLEAAELTGLDPWQVSKRCSDLRNDGWIRPIGTKMGRYGTEVQICEAVT